MCGIVAAVARRNVVPILIEGLKRLEYRGYDSAGVAVINGTLKRLRSCGRVAQLEKLAGEQQLEGTIGIGHTRWATHGVPSERNAHPHVSGGVSVVHNGIIENHDEVRALLRGLGYEFASDTDTEVIAHLVHSKAKAGLPLFEAVQDSVKELRGAYAIAVIAADDPARLVVARMGAPLLLGIGDGENFAASDTSALLQVTRNMIYLEEGDCAEVTLQAVRIVDARGHVVERPLHASQLAADAIELGSLPALHAEGDLRAARGDPRHARERGERPHARRAVLRQRGAGGARRHRFVPDPRLRHQLPRRRGRPLLDREPRRHALQRRDRERVPLPRERAQPARPGRGDLAVRARPPTRSRPCTMRRAWASSTRSPSATSPSRR